MNRPIHYTSIEEMCPWSKVKMIDTDCHFCIRIITTECIYFFQVRIISFKDLINKKNVIFE